MRDAIKVIEGNFGGWAQNDDSEKERKRCSDNLFKKYYIKLGGI